MRNNISLSIALIVSLFGIFTISCDKKPKQPQEPLLVIKEDTATARTRFKEIRESVPAQVAEGLTLTLWASDSLAPDPVAMSVDDEGHI